MIIYQGMLDSLHISDSLQGKPVSVITVIIMTIEEKINFNGP